MIDIVRAHALDRAAIEGLLVSDGLPLARLEQALEPGDARRSRGRRRRLRALRLGLSLALGCRRAESCGQEIGRRLVSGTLNLAIG